MNALHDMESCRMHEGEFDDLAETFYDEDKNIFYDCFGEFTDILNMITPAQLTMFRYDPGNNVFPYREDPTLGVVINEFPEEGDEFYEQEMVQYINGQKMLSCFVDGTWVVKHVDSSEELCSGNGCFFSNHDPTDRSAICRACRGLL